MYNDFWTQTPLGILEFSDQPIHDVPESDTHYGFFKASHVTSYLENYCKSRAYSGTSLESRIRLNTPVHKIIKEGSTWNIHAHSKGGVRFQTPSVIDATGMTSEPNWPHLEGRESFKGDVIHHKDFAKFEASPAFSSVKKVIVIGGAKSAADVAYSCAKAGKRVTWIIRRSGSGPAAFVSAKGSMGYKNSNEFFYTRLTSLFLVSLFSLQTRFSQVLGWLNQTRIGQALLKRTWTRINAQAHAEARYDRPEGKENGFFNLKPDTEIFWQNDSTGVNQRDDFFDMISRHVKVFREDISGMDAEGLLLSNTSDACVPADVVICATGWKGTHPFIEKKTAVSLGLPGNPRIVEDDQAAYWQKSIKSAEHQVLGNFPVLDSSWAHEQKASGVLEEKTLPLRLWKAVAPVQDQSILFLGQLMLGNHFRAAEVQALFACAVLDGKVAVPAKSDMEAEIAETVAWCRRRYLKKGSRGNWFYWDMVPYTDMLLAELGLKSHRHASWIKDLTRPCYAKDLRGLVDEFARTSQGGAGK